MAVQGARAAVVVATLLVVGLLGSGCDQVSSKVRGSGTTESAPAAAPARPILVTQDWGVVDGMVSVVVKNTTDRTLRTAEAVITARDSNDVLVVSSLEAQDGGCCSVTELPPGQEFGLYVDVGADAADITRVDVAYRDVAWAPADDQAKKVLSARQVELLSSGVPHVVVVADVKSSAPMVPQASVQAFLNGPDGEFLAVVSGRWFCISRGSHEIRMEFPHDVLPNTTIDRVLIHPIANAPDGTALNCAGPAQAK
jgi:hypothetical protein